MYVVDNRIQKFTNDGEYLMEWDSHGSAFPHTDGLTGVALDSNGNVYVSDATNHRIQKFTNDGDFLGEWGSEGDAPAQFDSPADVAVDEGGNIYVADRDNNRIQKFTTNGVYIGAWGTYGSNPGQFYGPSSIFIDQHGNLFVADAYNNRIQKFDSNGNFQGAWGSRGNGPGQFNGPNGLTVGESGSMFVADSGSNRVQEFVLGHPAPDPVSGLALNGSFEASPALDEWTYGGELPVARTPQAVHGNYALKLGHEVPQVEQGIHEAWSHQTIYIDPSWMQPTLSFKYKMFVNDIMDYSDFFVAIQDGVGLNHLTTVLRDGFQPCGANVAPPPGTDLGWRSASYDLSQFKGQYIRLVFSNRNLWPISWGIWTHVDDVRVVDAGPLPSLPSGSNTAYLPAITNYGACDPITASDPLPTEELPLRMTP